MKKFMIFLLMAFLYLGTCQARSEAAHFNNADVNLHSWVSPSTSGLLMDSKSMYADPIVKVTPSQPQSLCLTCPHNVVTFGLSYVENGSGEDRESQVWLVNDRPTDSTGTSFTFAGYSAGQYTVACRVTTNAHHVYTSNYVVITVDADAIVNIIGPDHACQNDVVTLTAQLENNNVEATYQWRRDGQYIVGATDASYSFLVDTLPGLTDTLVYEFDVQVSRAGCDNKYSPVHYFSVSPTPVTRVDVPLFCQDATSVIVTANSYTSGIEQPYMWKWKKEGSSIVDTTYVNYFSIANPVSGDKYTVMPIYQDFSCNADTATFELVSYQDSFNITSPLAALTVEGTPENVCLNGMATLTVTDQNKSNTKLGHATYKWYMNGALISGVTDTFYVATLPNTGSYIFTVEASYENYPCENPTGSDTIAVDTVPAMVTITGGNILCQNSDGTYTDTTLTAVVVPSGNYEYKWTGETTFSSNATKQISAPGVYSVIVKSTHGCETASMPFEVFGFGSDVQITSTQVACAGESVTLNANADGWTGNISYEWQSGEHTSAITVNPTADTWYKVTSTVNMGNGKTCSRVDSIHVLVIPTPTTPVIAAIGSTNVCPDGIARVYVTNAKANTHYNWFVNGTMVSAGAGLDTLIVSLTNPGQNIIKVEADSLGCVSALSNSVIYTVDTTINNITITGANVLCQNGDGTYNNTTLTAVVVPSGNYEYKWTGDAAFSANTTKQISAPGVYTVTVKTTNGCEFISAPYAVSSFGSDVTISRTEYACAGQAVTLSADVDGWTGAVSYEWASGEHSSTITVYPAADTWYKVTSTVNMGGDKTCSRTDSIHVLVVPAPATPTIAAIGSTNVCPNGIAQVNVTNAQPNTFYKWYVNGTMVSAGAGLDTLLVSLTNPGQNIIKVEADSLGCTSALSNSVIYTVDTTINNITITGATVLCQNGDSTYNDTTLVAVVIPTGTYQYRWSGETAFGTDSTKQINEPGVYSVTVKTTNGCEFESAPFEVRGFGADVQITVSEVNCAGEPIVLNANADGWTGNISYKWDGIDGNYSTITVFPKKDTVYKVTSTIVLNNGETCSREDSIHVYVLPVNPTIPTVVASQDSICEGSLAQIRVTNHVAGNHYVWYQNGVVIPGHNLDTISVVLDVAGEYEFAAAVVTANGCTSAASEIPAVVKVKAVPSLVNITGSPVVCENDSTVLKAHVSPEITDPKYSWSTGATVDSIIVQAGTYTVTVTNGADLIGCAATAEFTVESFGSEVQVTASAPYICEGYDVTLNAQLTGWDNSNITYQWYDGDGVALPYGTSNQVTTIPTKSGWYVVESTASSSVGQCTRRDSVYVTVESIAISTAKIEGEDTICLGTQTVLVAYADNADHYIWYENGFEIPGENLDTVRVMPAAPGSYTYSVVAVSLHGCQSKDTTIKPDVFVLNNPTVQITGDPIICNDSLVRLVALVNDTTYTTASNHDYDYQWRLYNQNLNTTNTVTDTNITIDGVDYKFTVDYDTLRTNLGAQDHPYIFTLTITNENGCVATSEPYNVYVGADVTVAVTIDHDTICEGGLVTATAHLGNYNMDNLVYQWYEINKITGDTTLIPHGTSRIYETYVDTSKVLMVNVTQTTTQCTIWGQDSVFVLPIKLQKILATNETHPVPTTMADTLTVCEGEGIYLTAYVINEETGNVYVDTTLRYVWYENGILMPGVDGPRFNKQMTILDEDTLSYQYQAYIDFGIEGCEPRLVASNVVFVKRNPIVTISGHHNVCYFGPYEEAGVYNVHLIAWVNGDYDPTLTYTWYEHNQERYSVAGSIYDNHYRETWIPTYDNPYSFTVMVRDSSGCVTLSEPFEVNVYNKPAVNVTSTETTICEGGDVTVTAHLDNYNDPNLIYQWYKNTTDPDNAIPGMTEAVENFVVDTTTTYIVKVTHLLENGTLSAQACFNYASILITANDIPVIDSVTTDLAEGNDTICEGRYVTFTAHISQGVPGGELYTWYRNGEVIATTPDPVYRETPQALNGDITVWDYAVKVTQAASGCESEIKGADTITVFPNPVLVLITDPIVCDTLTGNIVMHANVTPAPTSTYNFTWYEDNQVLADGTAAGSHSETMTVTRPYRDYPYSFSVELVNEYGCTTRDDAIVYVNDNPIVHATVTEENICVGGEITLTANLDDYNADMLEFHWYDNGVLIGTATELTYTTVPTLGEHKYNMTALQRNSLCIASSDTVTVNVVADPVIYSVTTDLAEGNDTICEGRYVTLTAHMRGGVTGGEVFTWYRNGQVIEGAVDSVYQETPQAINGDPTTYDYTVTVRQSAAGCESDVNGYNTITVLPNPVLVLVTDPIVCDTLTGNIVMHANVTPAPTSTYNFTWYEDNQVLADGTAAGSHSETMTVTRPYRDYPYSFSVELVNSYGCTVRDDATIYVNDNPIVHATVTDNVICVGGEITLTANLDDYNADMLEFHWYDRGVLIGTATELTYTTVPTLGEHKYSMTALQRNSLCIASSDTVTVLVNEDPIIREVILSDYIACEGAQIHVEAIPQNYTSRATDIYTWYRNGVRIPGATGRELFDTPTTVDQNTQQFVYTAVVTLEEPGCTSLPVSANALTIYRNPVVVITGDQHVCETDYTFLIANVDTVGQAIGNLHYTWFIDGQIRDNNAYNLGDSRFFAEYLYPRDEAYRFTVTVERENVANACASTSDEYLVYVYPKPEVNITANVTDICENGEVTLQANLNDYNADNITFQWYEIRTATDILAVDYLPGGGYVYDTVTTPYNYYIPGATGYRYTTTLAETTTIGVKVFQTNSECYDIDEFTVTVHPTPAAPIITVNNPMICSNGDVDLTITNDYSEYGAPVYAWMMDGVLIPGAFGPTYHQEPGLTAGTTHTYNAIVAFAMPGCISVTSDDADVVVIPDPAVTVTAEGPTTICEGGSVTFNANAQPTTLDYTYQWYDYNNQLMANETNATLTVSPAANQQNYNYKVVVNSLPGCQIVVDAPVVTVVADPVVTLSIDNPIICQGGVSTLTVNVEGGVANVNGLDPYVYNWYNNVNTETPFATTTENFFVLPTTQATDSFAYWVEVSANAYGCATTSMHVNQLVVADPVVNIIVAPTYPETVCDGGNTMLVATVQGGYGEPSYQWYRNETILVGETNPTLNTGILSVNDINSYRVIVRQTGSGCETASDTFQVPVIPSYNVVVSALNNATVCEGGTTTLEATITNAILPNDNPTFQWYEKIDGADVAITGATAARYTTSPLLSDGNHTYFVAVTSQVTGSNCSANSSSFYTAIVDDPTVVITTTSVNNVVCEGDVVRVNATVSPEGNNYPAAGDYTYTWTWTNGTNSYSYTNNEPTFAPTAAELPASLNGYLFNVAIASTDANSGCNAASNSNVYVTVMARPTVTISADNAIVCAGGHVELTANHNASDYTGFNYAWTVNGQQIASTAQTITVPASMVTEGNITANVVVTSSQLTLNCTSTASLTQPVAVVAQPTVSATADFTTMCAGAAPTLTATVGTNATNAPLTYVWQVGGNTINGANGNVYQSAPLAAGTYNFKVMVMTQDQALNCQSDWSDAVVVRVAETPVIGLTSADGLALCEGGNITLTATVLNAGNSVGNFTNGDIYGSYTYVWKNNNNTVATNNSTLPQNQITETLNTVGNYNYVAYVTPVGQYANGCGVAASEPLQVVVNARPNWDAAVVYPVGNICLGEEVQLHAHITGGVTDMNGNTNGHIQWVVEFNGVPANVANFGGDATHTPAVPGVYTYYPTYVPYQGSILGSGCSFTNSDQVSTFITVHELPTAAFVSGDGSIICANVSDDNAALTVHFTGTAPFHFIVTDLSNGSTQMYDSYTNDYTIYVNPDHTTQYRITYLSDNYCDNGELGLNAIATVFVNDILFSDKLFMGECDVNEVTINFNMISGTPNSEFTVTYETGLVVTGTIVNNTATFATPDAPGDYNAVFSVGGCDYDIIVRRPVFSSDFSDGTKPFMEQRWDDVVIINNNPATNGGHTFVSYQWYRNGELIPGAIYKNYQEEGGLNGFYSIEVVSKEADGSIVTYRTCEQYFYASTSVKVYPVPATVQQVVTIELDLTAEELVDATLDIYDAIGAIVNHIDKVDPITKVAGFKAAGTYFGRITLANGETKTVKFVIVK